MKKIENIVLVFLAAIELFVAFTAIGSGIALIKTNGLGAPISLLEHSPFSSYVIPGIILTVVVGGTHAIAFFFIITRHYYRLELSGIAAFGMLIWIFTQMYMIRQSHWLQIIYFSGAIAMLLAVFLMQKVPTWSENEKKNQQRLA